MKIHYPIRKADGREYASLDEVLTELGKMSHGWWLAGINRHWHGDIHVDNTIMPASVRSAETADGAIPLQFEVISCDEGIAGFHVNAKNIRTGRQYIKALDNKPMYQRSDEGGQARSGRL